MRLWRGQADISWRLDSSAFRRLANDAARPKFGPEFTSPIDPSRATELEGLIVNYEEYLIESADHSGFRHVGVRRLSDLELLAILRHYGAATRLLDTSRSALVALWFAASEYPAKTGALFGINSMYLGGGEHWRQDGPYADVVRALADINHPIAWSATGLTPRTAAQHSQFVYSAVSASPRGSIRIDESTDSLTVIALSPELKLHILRELKEAFDIHHYSLFPDIEGFAAGNCESREQYEMERW